jgi:nicotinamide-nucleotide amidase
LNGAPDPFSPSPPDDAAVVNAAAALGLRLAQAGWMVASVESCTGGLIARALTETAGSSAWFDRGLVTYTNDAKVELAGVAPATLQAHGAVSEAVAREMAAGVLASSGAQLVLSVTGIAGPTGAVPGKPVGTVCFGWASAAAGVASDTAHFEGDRAAIRRRAALFALQRALAAVPPRPID